MSKRGDDSVEPGAEGIAADLWVEAMGYAVTLIEAYRAEPVAGDNSKLVDFAKTLGTLVPERAMNEQEQAMASAVMATQAKIAARALTAAREAGADTEAILLELEEEAREQKAPSAQSETSSRKKVRSVFRW